MAELEVTRITKIEEFPIDKIKVGNRFRKEMGDLGELAESIKQKGVLQPITIGFDHTLVTGERRLRACQLAGLTTIPVIIRKINGELDLREIELIENAQRKDMEWQERARLEKKIWDLHLAIDPNWSIRKQTVLTDAGVASVYRRIELAKAIDLVPDLMQVPTQEQAWKRYSKLQEAIVVESLAKNAEEKYSDLEQYASNHYNIRDAFAGMKDLEPGLIHFAEVDPPYAIELEKRKSRNKENNTSRYREVEREDYGTFCKDMARLVYRALRPNTFCVWWYAAEWDAVIREILEETGFRVATVPAIWYKGQAGQTMSPDTMLASCYEPFFVCHKGMPKLRKAGRSNVFEFAPLPPLKKIHPTERPIELMLEILETFVYPGSTVVSPFLGSGSILRACYRQKIVGFGFDMDITTKHRFMNKVRGDAMRADSAEEQEEADVTEE
jgi:DNA modification methylase